MKKSLIVFSFFWPVFFSCKSSENVETQYPVDNEIQILRSENIRLRGSYKASERENGRIAARYNELFESCKAIQKENEELKISLTNLESRLKMYEAGFTREQREYMQFYLDILNPLFAVHVEKDDSRDVQIQKIKKLNDISHDIVNEYKSKALIFEKIRTNGVSHKIPDSKYYLYFDPPTKYSLCPLDKLTIYSDGSTGCSDNKFIDILYLKVFLGYKDTLKYSREDIYTIKGKIIGIEVDDSPSKKSVKINVELVN